MKPYIHILSHSMNCARYHAIRLGLHPSEWRYLHEPQSLHGYRRIHLLKVGRWWQGHNYPEIEQLLDSMDVIEVKEKGQKETTAGEFLKSWQKPIPKELANAIEIAVDAFSTDDREGQSK